MNKKKEKKEELDEISTNPNLFDIPFEYNNPNDKLNNYKYVKNEIGELVLKCPFCNNLTTWHSSSMSFTSPNQDYSVWDCNVCKCLIHVPLETTERERGLEFIENTLGHKLIKN